MAVQIERVFKEVPIPKMAPMLAMQVRANEYKAAHPRARMANFGLGEPPVTRQIDKGLLSLTFPRFPSGLPKVITEIGNFGRDMVKKMTSYSSKEGLPEAREYFLDRFSAEGSKIDSKNLAVVTGGRDVAFSHMHAAVREARADKMIDVEIVDARGGELAEVLQRVNIAQEKGNYVELILQNSADLEPQARQRVNETAGRGGVWLVDIVTKAGKADKNSLAMSFNSDIPATTLVMDRISELTGVIGVVGQQDTVSYITERHANIEGPPAVGEMLMHVKFAELARDENALTQLKGLSHKQRDKLRKTKYGVLGDVANLFEHGLEYIREGNDNARVAFYQLIEKQVGIVEQRVRDFYSVDVLEKNVVYLNGGGRGALMDILHMIHDLYGDGRTTEVIIPTTTWSYDNLIDDSGAFKYVYTDRNAFLPQEFNVEPVISKMEELQGQHAVLILPYGIHNPDGKLIPSDDMDRIVLAAAKHGVHLVSDLVYLDETPFNVERYSPAHALRKLREQGQLQDKHVYITTAVTYSKDFVIPGARGATVHTDNIEEQDYLVGNRDLTQINPMAAFIIGALARDRDQMQRQVLDPVIKEIDFRRKVVQRAARRWGLPYGNADWGYYEPVVSAALRAGGSYEEVRDETAARGALALNIQESMFGGPEWQNARRVSMSGKFGRGKRLWFPHLDFRSSVRHYFKVDEEVADQIIRRGNGSA